MPSRSLIGFITVAAAFSVANLYYAQPLAEAMARDFDVTAGGVSSALVGTQLGYAAGMLLLAPLCDIRERRATITATALACAIALLGLAAAPSIALLTVASLAVGLTASVTQMLLPFAVGLGTAEDRGRIVGTVMGGVLAGILLSRTVSGALGALVGWRLVFVSAAVAMAALACVMRAVLPVSRPTAQLSYRSLLASMWRILRREPVLRRRAVIGALGFAAFSVFWSTIAFHLAASSGGGSERAGMLGILGLSGIVVAPIIGRVAMRVSPSLINFVSLVLVALSFGVFYAGAMSFLVICAGVVVLDAGAQANHLANQTVIFGLAPEERSRVNALYMIGYFLGGALGTAVAAQAWERGGWGAVCIAGAAAALLATPLLRTRD